MVSTVYTTSHDNRIAIRKIDVSDLRWALRQGWTDFLDKRGDIIIVGLIYPLVGLLTAAFAAREALIPLIFPLVAGLSLLGPVVAVGYYELARRRETGEDPTWRHFFDVYRRGGFAPIAAITIMLGFLFLCWIAAAWGLYTHSFGPAEPGSLGAFLSMLFTTAEGWQLIVLGNLVGLAFAVVVLMVSVVSLPMLVDKGAVDPVTAVQTSVRAVWQNARTMALWGLIVAALLAIGSIPLFVGLAVVLPVLGYATWHLYTRLIER